MLHNQHFKKLNELGYEVLPHLSYSPDLLPTDYHFFKHLGNFLQGKHFHNQEAEKSFPRVCDFMLQEWTNISHWQKCVDSNGSCFD